MLVAFASLGVTTWNAWDAHRPGKVEASFEAVGVQGGPAFANVYIIPVTLFNTGAQPTMIRDVVLKASDCVIPAVALQPVAIGRDFPWLGPANALQAFAQEVQFRGLLLGAEATQIDVAPV